jgi:hypothetical protein
MKKLVNTKGLYLDADLLWSDAYWKLTALELHIYEIFKMKCRVVGKAESKKTKVDAGTIKNNGQIVFTYTEAAELGISKATFQRAINSLVKLGFLDIAQAGGLYRATLYSMSERWRKYGTDKFIEKEKQKQNGIPRGFIVKKQFPRHQK